MRSVFLTSSGRALHRWRAAFDDLVVQSDLSTEVLNAVTQKLMWVDLASYEQNQSSALLARLVERDAKVIALSLKPDDAEAYRLLAQGLRGYCHVEAVPEQFREVAAVVEAGGYWMPPGLVQRILSVAISHDVVFSRASERSLDVLTERENGVAVAVGKGLNNREIAQSLSITERTVKAHLTAIFEKLSLRDRVQLALVVNQLPVHQDGEIPVECPVQFSTKS